MRISRITESWRGHEMDEQTAMKLTIQFTQVLGRNSYEWVRTKVSQAKEIKKGEEQQIVYEEIINSLLQDKMELEMVAREYKDLYEKVTISYEDIDHLQKTIQHLVSLFGPMSPEVSKNEENIELLVELINKDTLKTMQLLGFNYKEAIGQPLTEASASAIQKLLGGNNKAKRKK